MTENAAGTSDEALKLRVRRLLDRIDGLVEDNTRLARERDAARKANDALRAQNRHLIELAKARAEGAAA